jgi:hypothetical protein
MASNYLRQFSSPKSKLIRFFERSRDRWKAKQMQIRRERKLLLNQTRAVEKSRAQWRERAVAAEERVRQLESVLAESKVRRRLACS